MHAALEMYGQICLAEAWKLGNDRSIHLFQDRIISELWDPVDESSAGPLVLQFAKVEDFPGSQIRLWLMAKMADGIRSEEAEAEAKELLAEHPDLFTDVMTLSRGKRNERVSEVPFTLWELLLIVDTSEPEY